MNICKDRHPQCIGYAEHGECSINPGWMIVNCPIRYIIILQFNYFKFNQIFLIKCSKSSCNACHLLDPKIRCQRAALNMTAGPAYGPGEMNIMFNGISLFIYVMYTLLSNFNQIFL